MTNLPATTQLSTLQQEISALTEQLAPAGADEIGRCIASLMDGGMMIPTSIRSDDAVGEYRIALKSAPLHGLRKAFVKLKRGEYENLNMAFIPLPNEFAAMARAEAKTIRDDLARAREKRDTLTSNSQQAAPVSPEARERVRALLSSLKAANQAQKDVERGVSHHEPMGPEQAEYWRKIMAAPVRRDVTEEQRSFNRKIEAELAAVELPEEQERAA